MASDGSGSQRITRDNFLQWKKVPTVRQVQKRYEEMAEQAKQNNRSVVQEMQAQGFKDYNAFNKTCDPFPLGCRPTDLSELGSGIVLYFQFLKLLGVMLFLCFVLQVPCMVLYAEQDWNEGWQWSSNWRESYSSRDPCACIGMIPGDTSLVGMRTWPAYGAHCFAWDQPEDGKCSGGNPCPLANPGMWMCRKWCYASPSCPTPPQDDDDSPSLTNVHYKGHVRSYSFCHDDDYEDVVKAHCLSAPMGNDVVFNESGTESPDPEFASGTQWYTPGNFGPNQAKSADEIPALYCFCIVLLCLCIAIGYQRMVLIDHKVDSKTIAPNDFAVMVSGLPNTATDENDLTQWFSDNVLPNKTTNIAKVVIGWDVEEFRQNLANLKELRQQLLALDENDPQRREITRCVIEIQQALASASPARASRLQSSGIVVVIFQHEEDMRDCVRRWNGFWGTVFYSDRADLCGLPGLWKGQELPMFPNGGADICKIKVQRAANPGDINWTELGVPRKTRYKMAAKTNLAMFSVICCTFLICYGMNKLQLTLETKSNITGVAFLPALVIAVMDLGIQIAGRALGAKEFHETKTQEEFSQALKMSVGRTINVAGALLFQHAKPREWYGRGGLVDKLAIILFFNTCMKTLVPALGLKYKMRWFQRRKLTDAKIEHFNQVLFSGGDPKDPAYAQQVKQVKAEIEQWKNTAFAPEGFDGPRRYSDALKTTMCCFIFAPVFPIGTIFGFLSMFMQYWVDKWCLLRTWKRPDKPTNSSMTLFSLRFLKYAGPLTLTVCSYLFLMPSWGEKTVVLSFFLVSLTATALLICLPMSLFAGCLLKCLGGSACHDDGMDYYKAQYMWAKEMKYHKDHFLYAKLPDSLNPEYLKPGTKITVKLDDIKTGYGHAAASAADSVVYSTGGKRPQVHGGHAIFATPAGEGPSSSHGSAPGPTTYGVAATAGGAAAAAAAASSDAVGSDPAPPATSTGGKGKSKGGGKGGKAEGPPPASTIPPAKAEDSGTPNAVWEFEVKDHWKAFAADCQSYIEKKYQDFSSSGGQARMNVNTSGVKLSLDFKKMTQLKTDTRKVSKIRRRETE